MTNEALKLAEEAKEHLNAAIYTARNGLSAITRRAQTILCEDAIDRLAALVQQEAQAEPEAVVTRSHDLGGEFDWTGQTISPAGTVLYTHPAPVAEAKVMASPVPEGWKIEREPTGELIINGPEVGVVVRENPTELRLIPEEALFMLATALLSAAPQPGDTNV